MQDNPEKNGSNSILLARNFIAIALTVIVVGATVAVAIIAIYKGDKLEGVDFIAKTLLPLWGTWIGTIMAFYFSRENFEAASKSYQNMIKRLTPDEKIAAIKVSDVMIPYEQIVFLTQPADLGKKLINEILKDGRFQVFNRYAVFNADHTVNKMIHRSMIDRYISQHVDLGTTPDEIKLLTLQDFLKTDIPEIKMTLEHSYKLISRNATLLEAKQAMDEYKECLDVFVTETGSRGPVLGLITNNLILEWIKG
jgi:hypothetical protein